MHLSRLNDAIDNVLDVLFPRSCAGCGAPGSFLCPRCTSPIPAGAACPVCGTDLDGWQIHGGCHGRLPLEKLVIAGPYEGALAKAIADVKYGFTFAIANELAPLMSRLVLGEWLTHPAILVPVPLHRARQAWRGFNQAALLAEHVGKSRGLSVERCLIRSKETPPQVGLGANQRRTNVSGAFAASGSVPEFCVLVDDVTTTGSTLAECARTLLAGGARRVDALILAHEERERRAAQGVARLV